MNKIEIVIIFIIAIIILFYIQKRYIEVAYIESKIDNRKYLVQNIDKKEQAADMLAKLNDKITKLLEHLSKKEPDNKDFIRLKNNYNVNNISEGTENENYTSYSVNKGEQIVFCLRDKNEDKSFVDENVLMYVATHELGHLMTKEIGHTPTFWDNFKMLLEEAIKIDVYKHVDYSVDPIQYCGINIKSSII